MKRHNDQKISALISQIVHREPLQSKYFEKKLQLLWEERFGAAIKKYTRSIRIKDHVLWLEIDSSTLRHELSLSKEEILEIANELLGERIIREVRLI
jgi:predicted nucleic acid-binding Zn ribbon protein